jgi:hypothetical protein
MARPKTERTTEENEGKKFQVMQRAVELYPGDRVGTFVAVLL